MNCLLFLKANVKGHLRHQSGKVVLVHPYQTRAQRHDEASGELFANTPATSNQPQPADLPPRLHPVRSGLDRPAPKTLVIPFNQLNLIGINQNTPLENDQKGRNTIARIPQPERVTVTTTTESTPRKMKKRAIIRGDVEVLVMAIADGYAMVRRPRCIPFVVHESELKVLDKKQPLSA